MNNIDLTPLVEAIITFATVLITAYLVPFIKSKTSTIQYEKTMQVVSTAVHAAEQLAKTGVIPKEEKKDYVIRILNNYGFTLDYEQIEAMIESQIRMTTTFGNYAYLAEAGTTIMEARDESGDSDAEKPSEDE